MRPSHSSKPASIRSLGTSTNAPESRASSSSKPSRSASALCVCRRSWTSAASDRTVAATRMSESVSAGTVVVGDMPANGPCPWTTDQTARIEAANSVTPAPAVPKLHRRPQEKRQLQRQGRLCRHGAERRQLDERAAEIGRPHHDEPGADGHRLGDARPRHRSDPARQPQRDTHDGGNDRQLREHVAEEAAGSRLSSTARRGTTSRRRHRESRRSGWPPTTARKKVDEPARRIEAWRRVAQRARSMPAATTASVQLVKKSARTSAGGHPVGSCTATWTGSTGSRTSHHRRGGTRRSTAVMMAFGGQMTDGVAGGIRSSRPRTLPR